ncbi:MAG: PD-(D/E)XK motif protein [Frankiaceae bacterium]|nr:PD-(D/E)XK motif protein [Frankiaceae bacterium]MBV9369399.1 PD-(D/E)XK motif protein [Frankiales bacterium]
MPVARDGVLQAFGVAERRAVAGVGAGALAVEPLDAEGLFMAAADREGMWALVIKALPTVGRVPAIRLATLSADYGVKCRLDRAGTAESVRVSLVRCQTADDAVRSLFATFATAVINELGPDPTDQAVAGTISRWVSLFWRLQSPPRTDVIGLIGELAVLDTAANTEAWAAAWHTSHFDAIDFGFTDPRLEIEVKATSGRERIHTLSLHQAVQSNSERYLASLFVELRDTGVEVGELARGIASRLDADESRRRFWAKIADACGQQLGDYLATRFIRQTSTDSLRFFRVDDVPVPIVQWPLPAGVSGLKFRSDFSSAPAVEPDLILGRH